MKNNNKIFNTGKHGQTARAIASLIVREVAESGLSLTVLLPRYLSPLAPKQKPLAQEISYGTLRWYFRLEKLLALMLDKPLKGKKNLIKYILLSGLYQLIYLDKPAYAVVKESVNVADELKQSWGKSLINAVLRRFLREQEQLLAQLDKDYATEYAYPDWLVAKISQSWKSELKNILSSGNQRPPMTLRVNLSRQPVTTYRSRLEQHGIAAQQLDMVGYALILDQPYNVEQLPGFFSGDVSVQDAAAQLAASLLAPESGERILDACAAPGGKTMHLLELQADINLLAIDISEQRLASVAENLQRINQQATLLAADAGVTSWWDGELFDRILLDAPCSATGVIRRHPDIKLLRRPEDLTALVMLQRNILDNIWSMLKPGGILVYATCSILREENDIQVENFLLDHENAKAITIEADWGREMSTGRQILPGENQMDGFYYAKIQKLS